MNREILFRGKRIDNGKWVSGSLFTRITNCYILPLPIATEAHKVEVDPETVGQYTGLTDENGKKIFEGDIFKFPDEVWESYYTSCGTEYNSWEIENFGVVGFCEDRGSFEFVQYKFNENSVEADLHENRTMEFCDFVRGLEIIGNIHDNPELLKGVEA